MDAQSYRSNALHQTLSGIVGLIKLKLDIRFPYVLPGKLQSDRLEGALGIYRQISGDNYCISTYQDFNDIVDILDLCFENSLHLSNLEKSILYYIPGYVAFKEKCSLNIAEVH